MEVHDVSRTAFIRYWAYPGIFGGAAAVILLIGTFGRPGALLYGIVALAAIACVALLERVHPYETQWLDDHGDASADRVHLLVNFAMLAGAGYLAAAIAPVMPHLSVWPHRWPIPLQVVLAGAILDAGLYAMHRASHRYGFLWRLHAVHHAAERLYWINGERRHPLSALVLATPGLVATSLLGAPADVVTAWLAILSVHLAFQHANIDYSVGPLRLILGVAQSHRIHHRRDYEPNQVNFGEFWLIWDQLFGTYKSDPSPPRAGDVGLRDDVVPQGYAAQLRWPFASRSNP